MNPNTHIFISHKSTDNLLAENLKKQLVNSWKFDVWLDVDDFRPSHPYAWQQEIFEALVASQVLLGVLTPAAIESTLVTGEWDIAFVRQIPVILLEYKPTTLPAKYRNFEVIDFTASVPTDALQILKKRLEIVFSSTVSQSSDPSYLYLRELFDDAGQQLGNMLVPAFASYGPQGKTSSEPLRLRVDVSDLGKTPSVSFDEFGKAAEYCQGCACLVGEPGAGKTVTLLQYAREAVFKRLQEPDAPIPIYLNATTFDPQFHRTFRQWVEQSVDKLADVDRLLREGRALLLIDEWDRTPSKIDSTDAMPMNDPRGELIGLLPENNRLIIAFRSTEPDLLRQMPPNCKLITLMPLTPAQLNAYLWLNEEESLKTAAESDSDLLKMLTTPLSATLFVNIFRDRSITQKERQELKNLIQSPGAVRDWLWTNFIQQRYQYEEQRFLARHEQPPVTLAQMYDVLGQVAMENAAAILYVKFAKPNAIAFGGFSDLLGSVDDRKFLEFAANMNVLSPNPFVRSITPSRNKDTMASFQHILLRDFFAFRQAINLLDKPTADQRDMAALALGAITDDRALDWLIRAANDADPIIRMNAVGAMGPLRDARAISFLEGLLGAEIPEIRANAAIALTQIKKPQFPDKVAPLLDDPCSKVRGQVTIALGRLGDSRIAPQVAANLRRTWHDDALFQHLQHTPVLLVPRVTEVLMWHLRAELRHLAFPSGLLRVFSKIDWQPLVAAYFSAAFVDAAFQHSGHIVGLAHRRTNQATRQLIELLCQIEISALQAASGRFDDDPAIRAQIMQMIAEPVNKAFPFDPRRAHHPPPANYVENFIQPVSRTASYNIIDIFHGFQAVHPLLCTVVLNPIQDTMQAHRFAINALGLVGTDQDIQAINDAYTMTKQEVDTVQKIIRELPENYFKPTDLRILGPVNANLALFPQTCKWAITMLTGTSPDGKAPDSFLLMLETGMNIRELQQHPNPRVQQQATIELNAHAKPPSQRIQPPPAEQRTFAPHPLEAHKEQIRAKLMAEVERSEATFKRFGSAMPANLKQELFDITVLQEACLKKVPPSLLEEAVKSLKELGTPQAHQALAILARYPKKPGCMAILLGVLTQIRLSGCRAGAVQREVRNL